MRTALLLLLAFAATTTFANTQTVWKWVDDKGVTHYSDRPVPGATRLELNAGSRSTTPAAASDTNSQGYQPSPAPGGPPYREFEISTPVNDEMIVNTAGNVTISLRIDPSLRSGHTMRLSIDNELVDGFATNTTSYDLANVGRGAHVAIGQIFDDAGRRVQETAPVRFYVRQESIAKPPVGPALRPPPKPQPRAGNKPPPAAQPSYAALNGERPTIDPRTNKPVVPAPKPSKPPGPKQGN